MACCNFNCCRRCAPENYDDIVEVDDDSTIIFKQNNKIKELEASYEKLSEAFDDLNVQNNYGEEENMKCCLSPDIDKQNLCQTCFTHQKIDPNCDGLIYVRGSLPVLDLIMPKTEFQREPEPYFEYRMMYHKYFFPIPVPEYRGAIFLVADDLPTTKAGRVELLAALADSSIDSVWNRVWATVGWVVIVVIAYLVTRFVTQ
jgi:hypothetical protein